MTSGRPSVIGLRDAVRRGERTAASIAEDALAAIAKVEPSVSAFLSVAAEHARRQAEAVDRARQQGQPLGPLAGVPIALKDNICTKGLPTTGGSKILRGFVPPYDATVVERLAAAGAVVVGKTNCDEFAMGSSTENSAFGPTANPWAVTHAPGGSSGGSAVAVATRAVPMALGSDTGGSIRQPAALCGVVGLKPSYGRVSRYGLLAFASSLDQIGPFTTTAADAAEVLAAIAGRDPRDATSTDTKAPSTPAAPSDLRGLRIGVPRAFIAGVDADVEAALESALAVWRDLGASVVDVTLPQVELAIPAYYLIATAEASSNLARYDGARYGFRAALSPQDSLRTMYERTRDEGFGAEVKRRIMLGTYVLSAGYHDAYYVKAQRVRATLRDSYASVLATVDVIATPTTPTPAFRLGEKVDDPLQMYLADVFTVSANLVGVPAMSLPCGFSGQGLPIGCQLSARMWDEATLIRAGMAFQQVTDWHRREPAVAAA